MTKKKMMDTDVDIFSLRFFSVHLKPTKSKKLQIHVLTACSEVGEALPVVGRQLMVLQIVAPSCSMLPDSVLSLNVLCENSPAYCCKLRDWAWSSGLFIKVSYSYGWHFYLLSFLDWTESKEFSSAPVKTQLVLL